MAQMTLGLDRNGHPNFKIAKYPGQHITLAPNVEKTVIVPSFVDPISGKGINGVLINHSKASDLLYKNGLTAIETPDNGPVDSQALNPGLREVKTGETLRFQSPTASEVILEWLTAATTAHK